MARLFVLDAMGLAYRAYYAFIARPLLNSRGENTSAIFGVANTALKIRREEKPDYWVLAWDGPGPTFRHERFPDYKATRKPMPADLVTQLDPIEDLAQAIGLPVIEIPGTEADDVMATLARRGAEAGYDVVLVTGDKDMLQAVNDRVKVMVPQSRDEYAWLDAAGVAARWGVGPEHIRDVLALMGDTSDNIPGVPGVGEKTAVELMKQFGSLETLYQRLDEVKRPALRAKLEANRELALLSRELATLRVDLDLPQGWDELRCAPIRRDALAEFAKRWEIRRLETVARSLGVADEDAGARAPARPIERRGSAAETRAPGVKLADRDAFASATEDRFGIPAIAAPRVPLPPALSSGPQGTLDLWSRRDDADSVADPARVTALPGGSDAERAALLAKLHRVRARSAHGLAILPVTEGEDARTSTLTGIALAARDGSACYVPIAHAAGCNFAAEEVRAWLLPAFADPDCGKTGHDLKRDRHALTAAGLALEGGAFDLHLASFLCDPSRDHSLVALARDVLGVAIDAFDAPAGSRRGRAATGFAALPVALAQPAAERAAACLFPISDALRAQLESREQWPLYRDLEHPLIDVLYGMERAGVAVDPRVLSEMAAEAAGEIARLEAELGALAGEAVNLNSGPQLAKLLFEKFALPSGRRTRSGYSTDSEVLEGLADQHPFPRLLLEYRALAKLKSTYLDALPAQVDSADGRVHTTFEPTGAATGRLSSSRPNLQNIPIRTPQGRSIRRAFVAESGGILIGADYSQIELRVMAHLSGDPRLIEAFRAGEDVHASTARRIFGVTSGELDPRLRSRAKIVNFGVIYGMGGRSLATQMGIPLADAKEFIRGYFQVYAGVREYLDRTLEEARSRGWVATLMGRRRYLPQLRSSNGLERSNAERAAINTPIQGSAADLVKLAMLKVRAALAGAHPGARLLLQVHDELLLECPAAHADRVAEIVRREMEGCYPMSVPLTVTIGRGLSWFDVH
ncbi:MAG: DNA polymerase I [Candidatus Eisenbacteria bacterium]|nr:DNA polymerase I [Candidatus Eisenbacteria bacterium]